MLASMKFRMDWQNETDRNIRSLVSRFTQVVVI
jgi:hypothetical protein